MGVARLAIPWLVLLVVGQALAGKLRTIELAKLPRDWLDATLTRWDCSCG
jgi:hypothetical protein